MIEVTQDQNIQAASDTWWTEGFYTETFANLWLDRDPAVLRETVDFLYDQLHLRPGQLLFDQCCGKGDLSLEFAKRGIIGLGVDASHDYINSAHESAYSQSLDCLFEVGDAFSHISPFKANAAINWYTSFGYTESDTQNVRMLENVARSLVPGGRFALDYYNSHELRDNFNPSLHYQREGSSGLINIERTSTITTANMLEQNWRYTYPDGRTYESTGHTKLYTEKELSSLLENSGFEIIDCFGDIYGTRFSRDSSECILIAELSR